MKSSIFTFSTMLLLMLSLSEGCKSQEKSARTKTGADTEKEMLAAGFKKGTIVDLSTEKGCTWLIRNDDTGELLLPLRIEEKFRKEGLKVWVKYQYSRRQQGSCLKGITITLGEMYLR